MDAVSLEQADLAEAEANVAAEVPNPGSTSGRWARIGSRIRRVSDFEAVAAIVVMIILLWAFFPGLFTDQSAVVGNPLVKFSPPSSVHWFGTDDLGRDVWSRAVHGTIHTLTGAAIAVAIGFFIGTLLGLVAATLGGVVEHVIMRFIDILLALPGFLIALAIVAAVGPGLIEISVAIGIISIATFARLLRAEVLRVRKFAFVEAAALSGWRMTHIMFREVLPNSLGPVLALVVIEISQSIIWISALGFLGYGAPPPTPEWGVVIADGRSFLANAWWITTLPGIVLVVTVVSLARLSKRLQTWRSI